MQVGAARGDPGPFVDGNGSELANGDSLYTTTTVVALTKSACSA